MRPPNYGAPELKSVNRQNTVGNLHIHCSLKWGPRHKNLRKTGFTKSIGHVRIVKMSEDQLLGGQTKYLVATQGGKNKMNRKENHINWSEKSFRKAWKDIRNHPIFCMDLEISKMLRFGLTIPPSLNLNMHDQKNNRRISECTNYFRISKCMNHFSVRI